MKQGRVMKKLLAVVCCLSFGVPAFAARYIDVSGNWAEKYVNSLSDQGVIPAEESGKFLPADPVTRAVFCAWMVKVLGVDDQPVPQKSSFADVKTTDWFFKPVEIMRQNNYVSAYPDGFRPHQFIPKGEMVVIISRALGGAAPDDSAVSDELAKFKDGSTIPDYARLGVAETSKANVLVNYPDALTVNATKLASRAETAALLYKLNDYLTKQSINQEIKNATTPPPASAGGDSTDSAGASTATDGPGDSFSAGDMGAGGGTAGSGASSASGSGASTTTSASSGSTPLLQGGVNVLGKGTHFRCRLTADLDSRTSKVGDQFEVSVTQAVSVNGVEAVPIGSTLVGEVTNVVSAKNFNFGKNGKIDVKFTQVVTPDGRTFPIDASIDVKQLQHASGAVNPVIRAAAGAGKGALVGAAAGGVTGAVYSAIRGRPPQRMMRSAARGMMIGGGLGAGVGLTSSAVRKGHEVHVPMGTVLPVKLDAELAMKPAPPAPPQAASQPVQPPPGFDDTPFQQQPAQQQQPPQQQFSSPPPAPQAAQPPPPQYPAYPPPVQQPYGYAPPQQPPPAYPSYPPPAQQAPPAYPAYPMQTQQAPPAYPAYPYPPAAH
jgi:hypothetical protein